MMYLTQAKAEPPPRQKKVNHRPVTQASCLLMMYLTQAKPAI